MMFLHCSVVSVGKTISASLVAVAKTEAERRAYWNFIFDDILVQSDLFIVVVILGLEARLEGMALLQLRVQKSN
jgi:hypothetical protein